MNAKFTSQRKVFVNTTKCFAHAIDARQNGDKSVPSVARIYEALAEYKKLYLAFYGEFPGPEEDEEEQEAE